MIEMTRLLNRAASQAFQSAHWIARKRPNIHVIVDVSLLHKHCSMKAKRMLWRTKVHPKAVTWTR